MRKSTFGSSRRNQGISTASLPDIIFILLFFFMVVTVMRENVLQLQIDVPEATELSKLENKSLVLHYYLGRPMDGRLGERPLLQVGDKIVRPEDIAVCQARYVEQTPEYLRPLITASLKIDKDISMGLVDDIKTELRKCEQLKINYFAEKRK